MIIYVVVRDSFNYFIRQHPGLHFHSFMSETVPRSFCGIIWKAFTLWDCLWGICFELHCTIIRFHFDLGSLLSGPWMSV